MNMRIVIKMACHKHALVPRKLDPNSVPLVLIWDRKEGLDLHDVIGVGEHATDDSEENDHDTEEAEEAGPGQTRNVLVQTEWCDDEGSHEEDHHETDDTHGSAPGRHNPHHHLAQRVPHDHIVADHRWNKDRPIIKCHPPGRL